MRRRALDIRSQVGQAIVMIALMVVVLFGGVGLAIDAGIGYYYNTSAERAAAAAALSGVIFMPYQFDPASASPAGSRNDATDRAVDEAAKNGFRNGDPNGAVVVTPAAVPGANNKLQVTVARTVPVFFMGVFGMAPYRVSRTAIATYLPPITLGQSGSQLGSTASQLGSGGSNYYFPRVEGWSTDRVQGDAYTPDPVAGSAGPSDDVHRISGSPPAGTGSDTADPTLPARGGYNYLVNIGPGGGQIQVYNAAFAPDLDSSSDGTATKVKRNHCENGRTGLAPFVPPFTGKPIGPCSTGGPTGSFYMHEEDSITATCAASPCTFTDKTEFSAMEYTLFRVNSYFIRASDTKLAQVIVYPIDATRWNAAPSPIYKNVNTGATITQTYDPVTGKASNMQIYHDWIDIANYTAVGAEAALVQRTLSYPGTLPPGLYRMRVDTLAYNGTNPPNNSVAHKGYTVRVQDPSGLAACAPGCTLGTMSDMCVYTPIALAGPGSFRMDMFQIAPDYAGQTITFDIYDPGDISGAGNVDIYLDYYNNTRVTTTQPVVVRNLGTQRSNAGTVVATGQPNTAFFAATSGGTQFYNGRWIRMQIPVPNNYAAVVNTADPTTWWWRVEYVVGSGVTATDTVTFAVGLKGNPAHLLTS
jgi:hypothetical protein